MHPVEAKRQHAFLAASQHRLSEGIRDIQSLLKQHPGHPLLLLDLAELELQTPDVEKASRLIEKALAQADEALTRRAASLLQRARRPMDAMRLLERHAQTAPALRLEWATALERANRLGEAMEVLANFPSLEPNAEWLRARILRRRGDTNAAIDLLRHLRDDYPHNAHVSAQAGHELAQALDDSGDFATAFQILRDTKNKITASIPPQNRSQWDARLQGEHKTRVQMIHGSSAAQLQRWKEHVTTRVELPPLVVLSGHPRSGTTLIEQQLRQWSGIASASEEQILRRSIERVTATMPREAEESPLDVLERVNEATRAKGRGLYRAFLGERLDSHTKVILDKEPSYLDYLPVLLRFVPEMKLVVVQRDPRDVLLSSLFLSVPIDNVSAWAWLDPQRAARRLHQVHLGWQSLRTQWPGEFREVQYEEVVRQPDTEIASLARFMSPESTSATSPQNEWISSPSYTRAGKTVDDKSVGRWKHYAEELAPYLEQLETVANQ